MIDFRYHLVSIVAVFLALAVGIVLGSTALADPVASTLEAQTQRLTREKDDLRADVRDLEQQQAFTDDFVDGVSPALVAGRLTGERAVLVVLPGASGDEVTALTRTLGQAGAVVTGQVAVNNAYLDSDQAQALDALVTRLLPQGVDVSGGGTPYDRAAVELASVLVTKDAAAAGREATGGTRVLEGFESAGFVRVSGTPELRATMAVVVAGEPDTDQEAAAAERDTAALAALATALDTSGRGTVAAGPPTAAGQGGVIRAIRSSDSASKAVSTVDVFGTAAGRVTVVLALADQRAGRTGQYGMGDNAESAGPSALPRPTS